MINRKALWCCLIAMMTCGLVFVSHTKPAEYTVEAEFAMLSLLGVFEDDNVADVEDRPAVDDIPARRLTHRS
jgi:hypothetical protein